MITACQSTNLHHENKVTYVTDKALNGKVSEPQSVKTKSHSNGKFNETPKPITGNLPPSLHPSIPPSLHPSIPPSLHHSITPSRLSGSTFSIRGFSFPTPFRIPSPPDPYRPWPIPRNSHPCPPPWPDGSSLAPFHPESTSSRPYCSGKPESHGVIPAL